MAPSTRQQYHQVLKQCQAFIKDVLQQSSQLPFNQDQINYYIAHLHSKKYKCSTIASHMAALSHHHKISGLQDPTASYKTAKLLTGVRKTQSNPPDARQPITQKILQGLIAALHPNTSSQYDRYLYASLFSLMYYACLRASEVLYTDTPQHMLHMSHLVTHTNSYQLCFKSYKHSTSDRNVLYIVPTGKSDCPVFHLSNYLKLRGVTPGPIFLSKGAPVTRHQFTYVLNQCLKYLQIPSLHYNTHSFRIGRTTDLALADVPHSTIQHLGRWKSNAYTKYIRPQYMSTNPI